MRVGVLLQARMGSTRLPGKMLKPLAGKPLIDWSLDRLAHVKGVDTVVVATGDEASNRPLVEHCRHRKSEVYCGSETDVLDRFVQAARLHKLDVVVRITGDCPFIDPQAIEACVDDFKKGGADYVANNHPPTYPDGFDVEVVSMRALEQAWKEAHKPFEREHVTPHIWQNASKFSIRNIRHAEDLSALRLTVDEPRDLTTLENVARHFNGGSLKLEGIAKLWKNDPGAFKANEGIKRNEGFMKSVLGDLYAPNSRPYCKSQAQAAKTMERIPGGAQTFSKGPSQYVAGVTPRYLASAKGARVTDVDGNSFIDTVMGLGPVTLGHAREEIDHAVAEQLRKGIAFSLPTPLEFEVAERISALVPCAQSVRFGKNGSDATAAAVRAARAVTNREVVACCGYHGWQDWYIGTTTRNRGVPKTVCDLTKPFTYNNLDSLKAIFATQTGKVACVIMEPVGVIPPEKGFLEGVRRLCDEHGAILIFDEVITGFRMHLGGAQAFFGVTPDLTCLGKALGNGHAISAVAGKKELMAIFDEIFFSFTAGGDASGLAAAKAVLDLYPKVGAIETLWENGKRIQKGIQDAIDNAGLGAIVAQKGYPPRSILEFKSGKGEAGDLKCKSLFQQEMAKDGVLTLGAHFMSTAHDAQIADEMTRAARRSFQVLKIAMENDMLDTLLEGPPVSPVFRRA